MVFNSHLLELRWVYACQIIRTAVLSSSGLVAPLPSPLVPLPTTVCLRGSATVCLAHGRRRAFRLLCKSLGSCDQASWKVLPYLFHRSEKQLSSFTTYPDATSLLKLSLFCIPLLYATKMSPTFTSKTLTTNWVLLILMHTQIFSFV